VAFSVLTMEYDPHAQIDHDGPVPPYRQLAAIRTARGTFVRR
jgi:hypothetical protein